MIRGLRRRIADALQRTLFDEPAGGKPPHAAEPPAAVTVVVPMVVPVPVPAATPKIAPPPGPRADVSMRSIRFGMQRIDYRLRRSRRRSIGFVVGAGGLVVSAPKWLAVREIDAAVVEKGRWIAARLAEQRELQARREAARTVWADGGVVEHFGAPLVLRLGAAIEGVVLDEGTAPRTLHVALPPGSDEARVRDVVQSWLQREARRVFEARAAVFAERLGVRVTRLSLSSAATRWGSASASGAIRLNWRLIHLPLPTIDYVVAHELAHLREMNHGPRFWATVQSVLPEYEQERRRLRDVARGG